MESVLEPILHSPRLPEYFREIEQHLRAEAERRQKFYDEVSDDGKWEFIDGQVIMHSPAMNRHLYAVKHLTKLLDTFVSIRRLGVVHTEKCMCKFPRNDYEPDVVFFSREKAAAFNPKTMLFPPPDLAVEVLSDSTAKHDRGVKFEDYEQHVGEYWIVDADAEIVEQYVRRPEGYHLKIKAATGALVSEAVAGFAVPVRAIFDEAENLQALESLLKQG
ncbi:MAG: Uma2 family endonuclease [Prosthecobacter sp.]|uniref:Uma2 family endonuclease n=1 Tax=Prosthecobacter sp. TaxID=1965333 RepID=UPI00390070F1